MVKYVVSQDRDSQLWYVHKQGFPYIPCFGTFCESKAEAKEYCNMYNGKPHKVKERQHENY